MSSCSSGCARLAAKGRRNWLRSFGPRVGDVWETTGRRKHALEVWLFLRVDGYAK